MTEHSIAGCYSLIETSNLTLSQSRFSMLTTMKWRGAITWADGKPHVRQAVGMFHSSAALLLLLHCVAIPAKPAGNEPLVIAKQGWMYVGGHLTPLAARV